jgi:hypothetical protein
MLKIWMYWVIGGVVLVGWGLWKVASLALGLLFNLGVQGSKWVAHELVNPWYLTNFAQGFGLIIAGILITWYGSRQEDRARREPKVTR